MPRNAPKTIRNFWIEAQIEGRKELLASGPKSKDGGFTAIVLVRHNGQALPALEIDGIARPDGSLCLRVHNKVDGGTWHIETRR